MHCVGGGRSELNVGTILVKCSEHLGQMRGPRWLNVGTLIVKCEDRVGQMCWLHAGTTLGLNAGTTLGKCRDHVG